MINALPREGSFDVVAHLTALFPARVIYRLIGFPREMNAQLLEWSSNRMKLYWAKSAIDEQLAMAESLAAYWRYCESFVAERMDDPGDDITGNLIRMHHEDPDTLSFKEVVTIVFGMVFAGQETTANSVAQLIYLLLDDRSRWDAVRADPSLIDAAFNEALRLAPPVAAWRRITTTEVEIGGTAIPAGSQLLLHLGSTGHDEDKFPDADSFKLDRVRGDEHMAFGQSGHFCLGAPLARLEARSLIETLIRLEPNLHLVADQQIENIPNISFRGPRALILERRT
jgi:cytochrome P450